MPRLILTDELWSKLKAILFEDRVYNKPEHRKTMEGIMYRLRVGCPWRDLPDNFGDLGLTASGEKETGNDTRLHLDRLGVITMVIDGKYLTRMWGEQIRTITLPPFT